MKVKEMTLLEKDHYVFHSCQRGDASKPPIVVIGSALKFHQSGHNPMLEEPQAYAAALTGFMSTIYLTTR
ncbi:MAG: hypothetical protein KA346_04015 [Neisseriaceae bacterium]|nr:hypothetical protein [Neisseriaceae bacterium]